MICGSHEYDEDVELLVDLLIGAVTEEGYEAKRYSEIKNLFTSTYDGIKVKLSNEKVISITVDIEPSR